MGAFAGALQGIGLGAEQASQGRMTLDQWRAQNAFNQMNLAMSAAQLKDVQERIKERERQQTLPILSHTFQTPDGSVYGLLENPDGSFTTKMVYEAPRDSYPHFSNLQEMEAYAVSHGNLPLLKSAQDAIKATQQKEPSAQESGWQAYVASFNGKPMTSKDILAFFHPTIEYPVQKGAAAASGLGDRTLQALANKWQNEGIKPPAKYQAAVEEYMEEKGMQAKPQMSAQEKRLYDLTNQIEPKIDQLIKLIEDNGLQNEGNFIFGSHSALAQYFRFHAQYQRGVPPEKMSSDLIKAAAALQVMGAAPWMQIGRGKYMFETISQHLPKPTDTPALLYQKAQFLKGIIDEARLSLPNAETDIDQALQSFLDPSKLVKK
jgi:hypothetical protein